MEYSPKLFAMYESDKKIDKNSDATNKAELKKYGKFERKNVRMGQQNEEQVPLSIFLVASVLEIHNKKLLQEAKGLDDIVKVSEILAIYIFCLTFISWKFLIFWAMLQILNDITGSLDAKKACNDALKLQARYMTKVCCLLIVYVYLERVEVHQTCTSCP